MKNAMIKMAVTGAMAGLMATTAWAGNMGASQPYGQGSGMTAYVVTLPAGELSEAEAITLLHMREEEKLARDVYTTLYSAWDHWAFERITQSEQRQMVAVLALMLPIDRTQLLARRGGGGGGGGRGPGDGTGNGGQGPKDGSGNGRKRGTCINTEAVSAAADMLLARGGNGGGGQGPGDGTGNGSTAGDCSNG